MKKLFAAALCAVMILLSLTSCSRAPEFSKIEGRLTELIEASYGVNEILFGKGLEVYPRVYEEDIQTYRADGKLYHYYKLTDEKLGEIYVYQVTEQRFFVSDTVEREGEDSVYRDKDGVYYYEIEYEPTDNTNREAKSYTDESTGKTYFFLEIEDEELGVVYQYTRPTVTQKKYLQKTAVKDETKVAFYEADGCFYYEIEYTEPSYDTHYR